MLSPYKMINSRHFYCQILMEKSRKEKRYIALTLICSYTYTPGVSIILSTLNISAGHHCILHNSVQFNITSSYNLHNGIKAESTQLYKTGFIAGLMY